MAITLSQIITGTVTTITAGAITLGAMTYWDGKDTVDNAITSLQEQGNKIELYEMNETELVNKIADLKTLRETLKADIAALEAKGIEDQATIDSLNDRLTTANTEIENLEGQLATANSEIAIAESNGDTLAQRIVELEGELNKANDDINRLQTQLDNQTSTDQPLTDAEMSTILEETVPTEEGTVQ